MLLQIRENILNLWFLWMLKDTSHEKCFSTDSLSGQEFTWYRRPWYLAIRKCGKSKSFFFISLVQIRSDRVKNLTLSIKLYPTMLCKTHVETAQIFWYITCRAVEFLSVISCVFASWIIIFNVHAPHLLGLGSALAWNNG